MKKLAKHAMLSTVFGLVVSGVALAEDDAVVCGTDRLNGLYVFSATGYTIVAGVVEPKAIVELIRFNGDGTLTVPGATRSINGVIAQIPPGGTGIYSVDASCVGSLSFNPGPNFDLFTSPRGEDVWMIQTNPNNVLQGNATRVSR